MAILTIASYLTKRVNKAAAPNLLRWSLRIHESLSSSSTLRLPLLPSPSSLSMLPLAQRIVSIEAQDDYRQLSLPADSKLKDADSLTGQISNAWDNFVERSWDLFFEDRHQRMDKEQLSKEVELEAERRWEARQSRRRQRRRENKNSDAAIEEDVLTKELSDLATRRVQILERYLRPALLPNESFEDFHRPLFLCHSKPHNNFVNFIKWMRAEYLIAKYGILVQRAVKKFPELRDDAAGLNSEGVVAGVQNADGNEMEVPLEKILPTVDTVIEAFGLHDWNRTKAVDVSWIDDGVEGSRSWIDNRGSSQSVKLEDIIHNKLRGQIANSGPLNAYFEMRRREDSYELWTREYIFGLASYLLKRIEESDNQSTNPKKTIILDVGAGDGRLTYFLRRAMTEIMKSRNSSLKGTKGAATHSAIHKLPAIIAIDDGSWKAPIYNNKHIQVEQKTVIEALNTYGPNRNKKQPKNGIVEETRLIVLCSWMPPGQDWTADFRKSLFDSGKDENEEGLAEEYILIGESDNGTCGHNWYTWGNLDFYPNAVENGSDEAPVPPYLKDGYSRVELEEQSFFQFSRFDCKRSSESKTWSFRRGKNERK
ncbi:hypothetical protein ACHAXS_008466 [Conticribra weissflogii]